LFETVVLVAEMGGPALNMPLKTGSRAPFIGQWSTTTHPSEVVNKREDLSCDSEAINADLTLSSEGIQGDISLEVVRRGIRNTVATSEFKPPPPPPPAVSPPPRRNEAFFEMSLDNFGLRERNGANWSGNRVKIFELGASRAYRRAVAGFFSVCPSAFSDRLFGASAVNRNCPHGSNTWKFFPLKIY
jgi:hypothetical protein